MNNNQDIGTTHHEDDKNNSRIDYLKRAAAADEAGDSLLSMYLYLAAFQQASREDPIPNEAAITGLKQAWALACANKERSLAEYIFELMEPYLSGEEISLCAEELQNLALDKLEEFGLSRDELENMANMISDDLVGMGQIGDPVIKIDHIFAPAHPLKLKIDKPDEGNRLGDGFSVLSGQSSSSMQGSGSTVLKENASGLPDGKTGDGAQDGVNGANGDVQDDTQNDVSVSNASSTNGAANGESGGLEGSLAADAQSAGVQSTDAQSVDADHGDGDIADALVESTAQYLSKAQGDLQSFFSGETIMNYETIAGYGNAIEVMRDFGIGMGDDPEFKEFVDMLNAKHGLSQMPALDTLIIRSPAREDANRFMMATLGELHAPTIHMRMEENYQGMPVLCVSAHSVDIPKNNSLRDVFVKGGVLVLEDLDLWTSPTADLGDDSNSLFMMQLTRGAREAVNLIGSAVNNPEVNVLVTCSTKGNIDSFFLDMLEPMSIIEIDYPTPEERVEIWMDISMNHPSINSINKSDLVRLSANMPRFDIYMAAREAIEEAYKLGLITRQFQPVTRDNLFDKLAAYQPLESDEYSELEDAVIKDFRVDLSHIDDLLKDE